MNSSSPVFQQLRYLRRKPPEPGDVTDSSLVRPDWYWIFRLLWDPDHILPPVGNANGKLLNPYNHLESALTSVLRNVRQASDDEFWNVLAVMGYFLYRTNNHIRYWRIYPGDGEYNWMVRRRNRADPVYDMSGAWSFLGKVDALRNEAERRCADNFIAHPYSRREYARLSREGQLTYEHRQKIEQRLLLALLIATVNRAKFKLSELARLAPEAVYRYPPFATDVMRPNAKPLDMDSAQELLGQFRMRMRQAMPNWSPHRSYPLDGQLRMFHNRLRLFSFYLPIKRVDDYLMWIAATHTGLALALRFPRTPEHDDVVGRLLTGAVANTTRALKVAVRRLGISQDSPTEACVVKARTGNHIDRKEEYRRIFTLYRSGHDDHVALRDAYRASCQRLWNAFTFLAESNQPVAAASFAGHFLQLEGVAQHYGFASRRPEQNGTSPDDGAEDPASREETYINGPMTNVRFAYAYAKEWGSVIHNVWNEYFGLAERSISRPSPVLERYDPTSDLITNLGRIFTWVVNQNKTVLLNEAARYLRTASAGDPLLALLLSKHRELYELYLAERRIGSIVPLLEQIRQADPAAFAAFATPARCEEVARLILQSYQYPAYADPHARSEWQATLRRMFSTCPMASFEKEPEAHFLTLSALGNLGLTVIKNRPSLSEAVEDGIFRREDASQPAWRHPTLLETHYDYPGELLNASLAVASVEDVQQALLPRWSRQNFDMPATLVMLGLLDEGRKVRVQVLGIAGSGTKTFELPFAACASMYDPDGTLETWASAAEDAAFLSASDSGALYDRHGNLHARIPWDRYKDNFVRLCSTITDAILSMHDVARDEFKKYSAMPVVIVADPEMSSLPWQLLVNRYESGTERRAPYRSPRFLVSLCPSVLWWIAALKSDPNRAVLHTQGVYLQITSEALPDDEGGDYRTRLRDTLADRAIGLRPSENTRRVTKLDEPNRIVGASLEFLLAHGFIDQSDNVRAGIDWGEEATDISEDEDAEEEELKPRVSVMLCCHGAYSSKVAGNAAGPLTRKLIDAKAAIGTAMPLHPRLAVEFARHMAEALVMESRLPLERRRKRCMTVLLNFISQDKTGCAQLLQHWGANDPLIWTTATTLQDGQETAVGEPSFRC